jgi:hypothetical protein
MKEITIHNNRNHREADVVSVIQSVLCFLLGQRDKNEWLDIRFEMPTRQWAESLVRLTVDLYLFDIRENTDLRQTDWLPPQSNGKSATRRMPPRRFDLRFMVTAIAEDVETEQQLLWWTLQTLLKHPELPPKDWQTEWKNQTPEMMAQLESLDAPLPTRIGDKEDSARLLDIWNALEAPPRPALLYIVTAPMDLEITQTPWLVFTRKLQYRDIHGKGSPEEWHHIAGTVRNKRGEPVAGALVKAERYKARGNARQARGIGWSDALVGAVDVIADESSYSGGERGFIQKEINCRTDAQGRYVVQSVPSGEVTMRVLHADKVHVRKMVVPAESGESYDIELDV